MSSIIDSKNNHRFFSKPIFFILLSFLFVFTLSFIWLNSENSRAFRADIKHLILNELIYFNPPPSSAKLDAIYILGGSQKSLEFKYKTASKLYHKEMCKRVWILSRPGKTEYDTSLGGNLTNDEWSILKLKEFGVSKKHIEPIRIKEGFFGTFTEAKCVSTLIKSRGYKSLILVSSPDHTHRIKISFEKFLENQAISLFVQNSDEKVLLRHLIIEFIKLKVYQHLLVR